MPELPEVETVVRGLAHALEGKKIERVELRRNNLRFPFPGDFIDRLTGSTVVKVTRRAKYILVELSTNDVLMIHLGMSGRMTVFRKDGVTGNLADFYFQQGAIAGEPGPHDHVIFSFQDEMKVVYTDPRRFGMMDVVKMSDLNNHRLMQAIGVEPLGNEFHAALLNDLYRNRKTNLKAALLDQKLVAGLGNIYVCEALHRSGLSPLRLAKTLSRKTKVDARLELLVQEIRSVLNEAIRAGGSTLRDFTGAAGEAGEYQQTFLVYDREGEPCRKIGCRGKIERIVQSGRSTFMCRMCQK